MNVLLLSTYRQGGAANSCVRLRVALQESGVTANFLCAADLSNRWPFYAERLSFLPYERDKSVRFAFSLANFGKDLVNHPLVREADVLNLHWVNQGFLSLEGIQALGRLGKPIIWTLHDMWAFTGGCHYNRGCDHFKTGCGNCQYLRNPDPHDLSYRILQRKDRILPKNIQFVTSSQWLRDEALSSQLLENAPVQAIPIPVDTEIFHPADQSARDSFRAQHQIASDAHILLFVAIKVSEIRKGFAYLRDALETLQKDRPEMPVEVIVLGKSDPEAMATLPYPVHALGMVTDPEKLSETYACADVFVIPSLEDNLPNTVLESLACGTPVVGFDTGGIPEMVGHQQEGYIAPKGDSLQLAAGIQWVMEHKDHLRPSARKKAELAYTNKVVAERYIALFNRELSVIK
jgi:glycosyltransferase involved in cell wall biosynthesis